MNLILLFVSLYAMLYPVIGILMLSNTTRIGEAFRVVLGVDVFLVAAGVTFPEWTRFLGFNIKLSKSESEFVSILICLVAAAGSHYFIYKIKQISRGH